MWPAARPAASCPIVLLPPTRVADIVAVVQRMHPELRTGARSVDEAESSRAVIARLSSVLGRELPFVDVVEFVEDAFRPAPSSRDSPLR